MKSVGVVASTLWTLSVAGPDPAHSQAVNSRRDIAVVTTNIPYTEAGPILEALREKLPPALKAQIPLGRNVAWPAWVSRHHEQLRERLERGDEDSIVNFWYYGTSFTTAPPLSARSLVAVGADADDVVVRITERRLDDLIAGLAAPGTNERLQFVRAVVERKSWDPTTADGREAMRRYFLELRRRVLAERDERSRSLASAQSLSDQRVGPLSAFTQFRDRGLSSDTSLLSSFTVDRALEVIRAGKTPGVGRIRRVAIVGPGLDFTDKNDGYDFYPLQTIQPFAVIDSLLRLGLSRAGDLQLTTFDLSPRINRHVETARDRARAGHPYTIQLPLDRDVPWNPDVIAYWKRFGDSLGGEVKAIAAPAYAGNVVARAVSVRPDTVLSITAQKLDIVVERLAPLPPDRQFDLIVATNVLVYYDVFEQTLALANVASMLRPGGLLLSNTPVFSITALKLIDDYLQVAHTDTQNDYLFRYQRQ